MSLDKLVNIGPITQTSVGDNLRLFLVWFIAIFNNISVFSLRTVLLVEEIGVPGENHRHTASHWQSCKACETSTDIHVAVIEVFTK
jgi:hypothetical protein